VFPASGVAVDEPGKEGIAERSSRWTFRYGSADARTRHDAVRAAAAFLARHPDVAPAGAGSGATTRAVLAIEAHAAFLEPRAGALRITEPDAHEVAVRLSPPRPTRD
jgi:hypothetical protein